jgi:hypothetical protein
MDGGSVQVARPSEPEWKRLPAACSVFSSSSVLGIDFEQSATACMAWNMHTQSNRLGRNAKCLTSLATAA